MRLILSSMQVAVAENNGVLIHKQHNVWFGMPGLILAYLLAESDNFIACLVSYAWRELAHGIWDFVVFFFSSLSVFWN